MRHDELRSEWLVLAGLAGGLLLPMLSLELLGAPATLVLGGLALLARVGARPSPVPRAVAWSRSRR